VSISFLPRFFVCFPQDSPRDEELRSLILRPQGSCVQVHRSRLPPCPTLGSRPGRAILPFFAASPIFPPLPYLTVYAFPVLLNVFRPLEAASFPALLPMSDCAWETPFFHRISSRAGPDESCLSSFVSGLECCTLLALDFSLPFYLFLLFFFAYVSPRPSSLRVVPYAFWSPSPLPLTHCGLWCSFEVAFFVLVFYFTPPFRRRHVFADPLFPLIKRR